jgi:hypothetical protein
VPPPHETGASLMLALVFVIVVFTIITGVLTYAFAAGRTVEVYQRDQALHYAADAALETAVQVVKTKTTLGQTPPLPASITVQGTCALILPLFDSGAAGNISRGSQHDPGQVFTENARLNVTCAPAPGTTPSGGYEDIAVGQGQRARDVVFEVVCLLPAVVEWDRPLPCGTPNNNPIVLGRAHVRYEIDEGHNVPRERARVPKVISWEILR